MSFEGKSTAPDYYQTCCVFQNITLASSLSGLVCLQSLIYVLSYSDLLGNEKLYKESGFCTLEERRKRHKLLMFHKMINYQCRGYLSNLVPPLVSQ